MSEAQATPSRLHSYAKTLAAANHDVTDSVKRLATAVNDYHQIRAKYINDPQYAKTAVIHQSPELPASIVDGARSTLAAALSTDDWVGAVGSAFQRADAGAGPGQVATADETTLAHMLSEVNGANLAQLELTDPKLYQQLALHSGDAWYLTGFFKALSHDKLELLLTDQVYKETYDHGRWTPNGPIVAQALATAYSTNQFTKDFTKTLSEYYAESPRPGDKGPNQFWDKLLKDLAYNPDSALNFSRSLTKDSAGNFLIQPVYVAGPMQTDLFHVLAVGAAHMQPAEAKALLAAVNADGNLPPLSPKQFEELGPALRGFILTSSYALIGPVPKGLTGDQITDWARKTAGTNLQALFGSKDSGLVHWAEAIEEAPRARKEWLVGLGVTGGGELAAGIGMSFLPEDWPLTAEMAVHLFGSALVYSTEKTATPEIMSIIGAGAKPTAGGIMTKYIQYASEIELANRLLTEGRIDPASSIPPQDLVKSLVPNSSADPQDSAWAHKALYEGKAASLKVLFAELTSGMYTPDEPIDPRLLSGG